MKIKMANLEGSALDWAVAKIEKLDDYYIEQDPPHVRYYDGVMTMAFNPSGDWSQGGPIIERERLALRHRFEQQMPADKSWLAGTVWGTWVASGPTPLVAAMRCYVASKLGDEVEVPE